MLSRAYHGMSRIVDKCSEKQLKSVKILSRAEGGQEASKLTQKPTQTAFTIEKSK
jgi:hypothetical protein